MTDRPKLYPGHQHQWADYNPHRVGLYTSLVVCTVCGLEVPRNAAGLDGRMAQPKPEQETRTDAVTEPSPSALAAGVSRGLPQPEQETRTDA